MSLNHPFVPRSTLELFDVALDATRYDAVAPLPEGGVLALPATPLLALVLSSG